MSLIMPVLLSLFFRKSAKLQGTFDLDECISTFFEHPRLLRYEFFNEFSQLLCQLSDNQLAAHQKPSEQVLHMYHRPQEVPE